MPLPNRIVELSIKYLEKTLTTAEEAELDNAISQSPENKALFLRLIDTVPLERVLIELAAIDVDSIRNEIQRAEVADNPGKAAKRIPYRKHLAAAILLCVIGVGSYFLFFQSGPRPGLTLDRDHYMLMPDGRKLFIDSLPEGLSRMAGTIFRKSDSLLAIRFEGQQFQNNDLVRYHTGREQYTLDLPDMSRVTLYQNASFQYPVLQDPLHRKVRVSEGGDFKVTTQLGGDFKVDLVVDALQPTSSIIASIIVHGTRFQIHHYPPEKKRTIYLIEGLLSVVIGKDTLALRPLEMVVLEDKGKPYIQTNHAETADPYLLSKPLSLKDVPIQTVITSLQQQYHFPVRYTNKVPDRKFSMTLNGSKPLTEIIHGIQRRLYPIAIKGDSVIIGY